MRMTAHVRRGCLCLLAQALTLGVPRPAAAQVANRPFADLGRYLHPGDTVIVISRENGEVRGGLVRLSPTSLVVAVDGQNRELLSTEIGSIDRRGDPLWGGALIERPCWG